MNHVPGIVTAAGVFASVYGVFARFDRIQTRNNRQFVGRWLTGLSAPQVGWDSFFVELFDGIFGTRHWSVKCVFRSVVLSLFIMAMLTFYLNMLSHSLWLLSPITLVLVATACITDYFSLWKTRYLLTRFNTISTRISALGLIFVDFIATSILYYILFAIAFTIIMAPISLIPLFIYRHASLASLYREVVFFSPGRITSFFYYLVALLTSAWLWTYVLGAYAMRLLSFIPVVIRTLSKILDLNEHPVRSLGYVVAALSAMFWILFSNL